MISQIFRKVSSYVGTESQGVNNVKMEIKDSDHKDKHILIIEDIYDTGNCMKALIDSLQAMQPASVKTCILLHKMNPKNEHFNYYADFLGYFVPLKFLVGYGLDYNQHLRELPHVCVISERGVDKYKE